MNYKILSSELLRVLRGRRSRGGFSRFLGYKSNIAQRWETGQCWPTASRFFQICVRLKLDPQRAAQAFLRDPKWRSSASLEAPAGVGALLSEIRGRTSILNIAERAGYNRYSVARWFAGTADPKLPEFLCLVDAANRRTPDLLATLVDPELLPTLAGPWKRLEMARRAAFDKPYSHAVLRAMELAEYKNSGFRDPEYFMRKTGVPAADVEDALRFLAASGQVKKTRRGWRVDTLASVDTGGDQQRSRQLKATWTRLALERLEVGSPGNFGYSVFAIAKKDLERLKEIQLAYVREMQTVIAASQETDCVGLYCAQLLDLACASEAC